MDVSISLLFMLLLILTVIDAKAEYRVSETDIKVLINSRNHFILYTTEKNRTDDNEIFFESQHVDLVRTEPAHFIAKKDEFNWTIDVLGLKPGYAVITTNITNINPLDYSEAFVRVTVERSNTIYHISSIVGWIYFAAWSISFYPQIYSNYKRKSVVGLNFDYISLNLVGFIMYAVFNCGLYWIPEIEQEYFNRYPKGLNPVQVNDIFFSLHAVCATVFGIFQCFMYEIGSQRVSTTARIIHGVFSSFVLLSIILAILHIIQWLDFLYYCSYVKLAITLIKYVPQAFYNYKRQSTVGWSIGNIFLDFTGGILSMLQMILNAYNYDDWESIFGDPTKFGLGFFSVAFDIFFLIQHYVLYRMASKVSFLLKSTSVIALSTRNINCLVAAITKPHRKVYLKQFMTVLQHPDGSTIKIRYHEPIGIIRLPLDLSKLSEKERKAILLERQPTPKKIVDDCEIENTFDENRYLKF